MAPGHRPFTGACRPCTLLRKQGQRLMPGHRRLTEGSGGGLHACSQGRRGRGWHLVAEPLVVAAGQAHSGRQSSGWCPVTGTSAVAMGCVSSQEIRSNDQCLVVNPLGAAEVGRASSKRLVASLRPLERGSSETCTFPGREQGEVSIWLQSWALWGQWQ